MTRRRSHRPETDRFLEQLQALPKAGAWRIRLDSEVEHFRFLRPDVVRVKQPYRRVTAAGQEEAAESAEPSSLGALVLKGSRGWRFVRLAQPAQPRIAHVGGQIREPRKLKDVPPRYPEDAKAARVQGMVILECTISPEGNVTDVRVLRGIPLLDQAAIHAVKQWRYTPTLLNGVAVPVVMTVTVNFRLW